MNFALNHVTMKRFTYVQLLDAATELGCIGVEVRNDLGQPLFDGIDPKTAGQMARDKGLRILALAEVKMFDDWSDAKHAEAAALMKIAVACGAEAVSLIPRNDGEAGQDGTRQPTLAKALAGLKPLLEDHGLTGLIEPLGFASSSLRFKTEAVSAIAALGAAGRFKLVHDTFHHAVAGGGPIFAANTGIIHVSGVTAAGPVADFIDPWRGMVDANDRLDNIGQVKALQAAGNGGAVSFECFAPVVHEMLNPVGALRRSMDHIAAGLLAE